MLYFLEGTVGAMSSSGLLSSMSPSNLASCGLCFLLDLATSFFKKMLARPFIFWMHLLEIDWDHEFLSASSRLAAATSTMEETFFRR
jgi:hypothetical protein